MKTLVVVGGLLAVGAYTFTPHATGATIERVASKPQSVTYSAFQAFTNSVAARQIGSVCVDRLCDEITTIHFVASGKPQQSLSLKMLRGPDVMASALAKFAPGDTPSSTRVSINVDNPKSTTTADRAKLEALVDAMIGHVNRGEAIPTDLVTTGSSPSR